MTRYVTKATFRTTDEYGEESITADTVIEQDNAPTDTGLVDYHGNKVYRVRDSVKLGFVARERS